MKILLTLAIIVASSSSAIAQSGSGGTYYAASPTTGGPVAGPGPYSSHRGFMAGIGIGGSGVTCENCDGFEGGGAIDYHLGVFLNPRLALMYDGQYWIKNEDDATLAVGTHSFAAQYWVLPMVWVKAGAGLSQAHFSFGNAAVNEFGFGLTGAAGFEVVKTGNFALDLSLRFGIMEFEDGGLQNISFLVGFNWT